MSERESTTPKERQARRNEQPRTDRGRYVASASEAVESHDSSETISIRSRQFRKRIRRWLSRNIGHSWSTLGELHRDVANDADCSMQTASRWIFQYTGPGQPYRIEETADLYILRRRGVDELDLEDLTEGMRTMEAKGKPE